MDDSNKTKPFYNSTIPGDWDVKPLGSLGSFSKGKGIRKSEVISEGIPCVRYGEIYTTHDYIIREFGSFISEMVSKESTEIENGDILFAGSGETVDEIGKAVAYVGAEKAFAGGDIIILSTNKKVNCECLAYALEIDFSKKQKRVLGQGNSVVHIYSRDLAKVKIPLPPLPEQRAIAHVLGLMDRVIQHNNQLIEQKNLRKKWLMQNLLTGKKRLKGFSGDWKTHKLGEVSHESTTRNNGLLTSDLLMGVNKSLGIIPMRKRVQGKSVDRCKVIEQDSFAYNPMRLNIGSIARWTENKKAIVSGDYVVFRCDEKRLDPNYLDFFRESNVWTNFVIRAGDGSVRVRIYFSHLKHLKINLPPLEEQTAIARVLQTADKEIELLEAKGEKLREQKKGLMQQLLTGKKRLRVEEV